ncbi:splicing factor 3B subunit 5 [Alligator sinensis]|uniref:Splicing factor 3B subunit 5 n=1 Tax=Alligator sinensis TaxID=38654 RepID=A0A1U8D374_ALLSI|nr:splicing factor 3B subunit 5 [Alligator sinensis]
MTDRYTIHSQLEHLQSKYIGTGHADTTKWEWLVNQHRDSYCSYMGHFDLLNYFAIAENESKARVRFNLTRPAPPCAEPRPTPAGTPAERPEGLPRLKTDSACGGTDRHSCLHAHVLGTVDSWRFFTLLFF